MKRRLQTLYFIIPKMEIFSAADILEGKKLRNI
jgi:hypothetical protein